MGLFFYNGRWPHPGQAKKYHFLRAVLGLKSTFETTLQFGHRNDGVLWLLFFSFQALLKCLRQQ